jgi:hypothetical protein
MTEWLPDVVWLATLVTGLMLSAVWRARLAGRAAPAIAGFALLLADAAVAQFWEPRSVAPASSAVADLLAAIEPADLAIALASYVAYPVGLGLLVLAVLRTGSTDAGPTATTADPAGRP